MAKRGVAYIKPDEPNFIKKLKMQIGYKESDNVNTKFEQSFEDFDKEDKESEEPQVVVLKPGDLTAEEVKQIKQATDEKQSMKADLTQKIVFNPNVKKSCKSVDNNETHSEKNSKKKGQNNNSKKHSKKPVLSFDYTDENSD